MRIWKCLPVSVLLICSRIPYAVSGRQHQSQTIVAFSLMVIIRKLRIIRDPANSACAPRRGARSAQSTMTNRLGSQRFENWLIDKRSEGFACRLLAEWMQWRCGCTQRQAREQMQALPAGHALSELIDATFRSLGKMRTPEPEPPRRGQWKKSSNFGGVDGPRRIVVSAAEAPSPVARPRGAATNDALNWSAALVSSKK